jgi:YHS domain-containing protein
MIQDSVQPRDGIEYAYNGKTYYLCCMGCVAGFQKHPARYSQATDPVSGALVDKADARIYAHEGRAYFFRSDETLAAFAREPEKFLRRAPQPEMWSGEP